VEGSGVRETVMVRYCKAGERAIFLPNGDSSKRDCRYFLKNSEYLFFDNKYDRPY
jgi:hypothetical protein